MCIKSLWSPQSSSFRSGFCITYNSNCWCDDALDGASGDCLDLETHLPVLGTVWEKNLPVRACPVQHHHFPRTVYEFTHPGHYVHMQSKPDSSDLLLWCKCRAHIQFTALDSEWRAPFKFRALKYTPIRQHSTLHGANYLEARAIPLPFSTSRGHIARSKWDQSLNWNSWASLITITEAHMKILGNSNCVVYMPPFRVLELETEAAGSQKAGTET